MFSGLRRWDLCIYLWILFVCVFNIPVVILWVQVNRKKTVYFLYLGIFISLLRLPYQLYLHLRFPSLHQKFSIVQAMIFCYIRQSTLRQVIYPKVLKGGYMHIYDIYAHVCSWQNYSQQLESWSNPHVL